MARRSREGTGADGRTSGSRSAASCGPPRRWPATPTRPAHRRDRRAARCRGPSSSSRFATAGELLGALSIRKPPGEALRPTEVKLLDDLAAQAGLVMRNAMLTEDLLDHIEQLRASRQRLVACAGRGAAEARAQPPRRRAATARRALRAAPAGRGDEWTRSGDGGSCSAGSRRTRQDALENLRDLARGIYPPLLADKGLAAALEAQARKAPIPIEVDAEGVGRYPQEVEAAVYFCALEALNNVAKYAEARRPRSDSRRRTGA